MYRTVAARPPTGLLGVNGKQGHKKEGSPDMHINFANNEYRNTREFKWCEEIRLYTSNYIIFWYLVLNENLFSPLIIYLYKNINKT